MDFDDEGDAFDEITATGSRQTKDEEFEATGGKLPRFNRTGPGSAVKGPKIRKLADERWVDHFDDPHVERDVLRRAKAGHQADKLEFYRAYHKTLLDIASDAKYGGPPLEEKLSAASVGFWKAFKGFNLSRNNGFYAYAINFIEGAICDCITNWHYRGQKHETRAARKDRSSRPIHVQYNGVEGSHYDMEGLDPISASIGGWIAADDHELRECDGSGGKVTDADWARIVVGRAVPTNWPNTHEEPEPCKPISHERYATDQATAYVFDTAEYVRQRLSQRLATIATRFRVPPECVGADENPHRNGGRHPTKSKFPSRDVFSETTTLQLKDGSQRKVFRQKEAGTLDRYASATGIPRAGSEVEDWNDKLGYDRARIRPLPLHRRERDPRWQGPELPLYLDVHPTPGQYKAKAPFRGNAPALGMIGHFADPRAQSRVRRTNQPLKEMRRLARVGRQQYAQELVAKKLRAARLYIPRADSETVPLFEVTVTPYSVPVNTMAAAVRPPTPDEYRINWRTGQFEKLNVAPWPLIYSERDRYGVWADLRRVNVADYDEIDSQTNVHRRMASLVVAVDNEGKIDAKPQRHDALQSSGGLHSADGSHSSDIRKVDRAAG